MLLPALFSELYPMLSKDLPLAFIFIKEWILIKLYGKDIVQYLHNQFTCDIKNLNKNKYSFSAHCNPQGKMFSNMCVFYLNNQEIALIERLNIHKKQILEMKKYAVFSDIIIIPDYNAILIGIAGTNARKYLSILFSVLPDNTNTVVHNKSVTLLYFNSPTERFLLIINKKPMLNYLLNKLRLHIKIYNSCQWAVLDMEAGYPIIEPATSELFIPQSVNMDILQGISFNKGCYMGQESIARIQYRGRNKYTLHCFFGSINYTNNYKLPIAGDRVELKINNQYWKNIGTVLQSYHISNDTNIITQAVLNTSIPKHSELRIKNTATNKYLILLVMHVI